MKKISFKPNLLDIKPQSLAKVFLTIDTFTNLDLKRLCGIDDLPIIINDSTFNIKEKYYILYYLKEHLNNKNSRSFISRQLEERRILVIKETKDSKEIQDFMNWQQSLLVSLHEIRNFCKNLLPEYERLYLNNSYSIDKYENYNDLFEYVALKIYRLPLIIPFSNKDNIRVDINMQPIIEDKLKHILSKADINAIIRNTFNYKVQSPPSILNLEYKNIGTLRRAFFEIYKAYKNEIDNLKNNANSSLQKLKSKELSENYNKRDFIVDYFGLQDEKHVKELTNKMNFARILFISFFELRQKYVSSAEGSNRNVDHYIYENICKNLKKA